MRPLPALSPPFARATSALAAATLVLVALGCRAPEAPPPSPADPLAAPVQQTAAAEGRPPASSRAVPLQRYAALGLADAFAQVQAVRFEPYAGIQRGASGTAAAGRGNSLDQALLLAAALADDVAAVRFAQSRLNEAQVAVLLDALYSRPHPMLPSAAPADPYRPAEDAALVALARDHYWLQVKPAAADAWMDLDPTFPGLAMGDAPAAAARTFAAPSRSLMQTLTVTLKQENYGGVVRTLGRAGGPVSEFADQPVSITLAGVPAYEADPADDAVSDGSPVGGSPFGGLLGGAKPSPKPAPDAQAPAPAGPVVGTAVTMTMHALGTTVEAPVTTMRIADTDSYIKRTWIEFTLQVPGQPARQFERALYESNAETATRGPRGFHRYNVVVVAGPVTRALFEARQQQAAALVDLPGWEAAGRRFTNEEADAQMVDEAKALEHTAGAAVGPLVALAFAAESDSLSRLVARRGGVELTHPIPRVLLTSVETQPRGDGSVASAIKLDLRLDEVAAIPYPGMPRGAATLYQMARGLQESALEGAVLERFLGRDERVVTTAEVMKQAEEEGVAMLLLLPENRMAMDELTGLTTWDGQRIRTALDAGDQIIIPARPVAVEGAARLAWWQVDGDTGALIGVMEGGGHQAMTEYNVPTTMKALAAAQGYMLGMLNGAVGTQVLLAAGMLKYGRYTDQLKREVKAKLQYITCIMCPKAELEISLGSTGGVTAKVACYEFELIKSHEIKYSKTIQPPFCKWYKMGFSCSSSLLLEGLHVDVEVTPGGGPSIDWTIPYNCGGGN